MPEGSRSARILDRAGRMKDSRLPDENKKQHVNRITTTSTIRRSIIDRSIGMPTIKVGNTWLWSNFTWFYAVLETSSYTRRWATYAVQQNGTLIKRVVVFHYHGYHPLYWQTLALKRALLEFFTANTLALVYTGTLSDNDIWMNTQNTDPFSLTCFWQSLPVLLEI